MYKSTSDRSAFQERIASHSTKGYANGRVEVLPPSAKPEEIVYGELKEQFEVLEGQILSAEKELRRLEGALRITMPHTLFEKILSQKRAAAKLVGRLKTERGELRHIVRAAGEKAFAECFYYLASARLPKDTFRELDEQVINMMGRNRHEIMETPSAKQKRHRRQTRNWSGS